MNLYTYADRDLLVTPNTYFYTRYCGEKFIADWKKQRQGILKSIVVSKTRKGKNPKKHSIKTLIHRFQLQTKVPTVLSPMMFVKRFEIDKRWYLEYDAKFRPLHKGKEVHYSNLELYFLAAEIFASAYGKYKQLPFLNALLKSVDTLCSIYKKLNDKQRKKLAQLIESELLYANLLAKSKRIIL